MTYFDPFIGKLLSTVKPEGVSGNKRECIFGIYNLYNVGVSTKMLSADIHYKK